MFRRVLIASVVFLAFVAATSRASSTTISPCRRVSQAAMWSPDGTQIAYYGRRWPPPAGRGNGWNVLQAFCTANADGTNTQPLRYTVCSDERCPGPPDAMVWLQSGILYLRYGHLFRIVPGQKPQKFAATINSPSFALDAAGDRIAAGAAYPGCLSCAGPVTVISLATGRQIGTVGGKKLDNVNPSPSPDGTKVAFERDASNDSGQIFGIWTAKTSGSQLRRLVKVGQQPLWSPTGGKIAYVAPAGKSVALRLVSAEGGKSRALVSRRVQNVFGWSPDGRYIAFETGKGTFGKLAVVDVTTGKVRSLLQLKYDATAVWKPDSSELLAYSLIASYPYSAKSKQCWALTRVPVNGSKPTLISSCR